MLRIYTRSSHDSPHWCAAHRGLSTRADALHDDVAQPCARVDEAGSQISNAMRVRRTCCAESGRAIQVLRASPTSEGLPPRFAIDRRTWPKRRKRAVFPLGEFASSCMQPNFVKSGGRLLARPHPRLAHKQLSISQHNTSMHIRDRRYTSSALLLAHSWTYSWIDGAMENLTATLLTVATSVPGPRSAAASTASCRRASTGMRQR